MIQCGPSMETWLSALEIADLVRRKEVKPLEVLDAILARLEAVNPTLNAFCLVTADARGDDDRWLAALRRLRSRGRRALVRPAQGRRRRAAREDQHVRVRPQG